jgi:hypothetical protein
MKTAIPDRSTVVPFENVTIIALHDVIEVTAPADPMACNVFEVIAPGFKVVPTLRVDNTGCSSDLEHDQIPLVFEGPSAAGSSVSIIAATTMPAAVSAVGYDRGATTMSKIVLDVSGLEVNITAEMGATFTSSFAAVFSRVSGVSSKPIVTCPAPSPPPETSAAGGTTATAVAPDGTNCSVFVWYAGADDGRNLTWGADGSIGVVDGTDMLSSLAHQEKQLHATSTARFQTFTVVYFAVLLACLVVVVALFLFVSQDSF